MAAFVAVAHADIMFRFRHLLDEHRAEIAAVLSSERGKVRADAAPASPRH